MEEQCKNLPVQKWRKSISRETRSSYTGVKWEEDYEVLGRDKGTTYNRRANKVKVTKETSNTAREGPVLHLDRHLTPTTRSHDKQRKGWDKNMNKPMTDVAST